jgi:signal transduction histidine kinase
VSDPAWQASATRALAAEGVDVVVSAAPQIVKRAFAKVPGAAKPAPQRGITTANPEDQPTFATPGLKQRKLAGEQLTLNPPTLAVRGREGPLEAEFFVTPASGTTRLAIALAAGLAAALAVVVLVGWLLRRWVVRPLGQLAADADRIAGGDLEPARTRSRATEIARVGDALHGMAASLRETAARDARADAQRRFLLTALAHDLRTPLFTLRGSLEALDRGLGEGNLARAQRKAAVLDDLVSDLFAYSRMQFGPERRPHQPVDLREVVAQAAEGFPDADLALDAPGVPVVVEGDETALVRVVANLVDNALRHGGPGRVEVALTADRREAMLAVRDRGPGLDPDELELVFEPLYRGDGARNGRGTGLGLAIVAHLVEAHGGMVTAANDPSGGARFEVRLPVHRR